LKDVNAGVFTGIVGKLEFTIVQYLVSKMCLLRTGNV